MMAMVLLTVLPVILLWSSLTVTVESGHAGLTFHTFGNGVNPDADPMSSGFHLKLHGMKFINTKFVSRKFLNT